MKTILITILLAAFTSTVFSSEYEEIMSANIQKLYTLTESDELINLANQFERISNAEQDKWEPAYYAAYCYVRSTLFGKMGSDDIHIQLDNAQKFIDQIIKTNSKESEIHTLQALVYQLRITDMSKGYKYSKMASESLVVAETLNANNPRIYYLRGSNIFHTPKAFGGGADKAKPYLQKADEMFKSHQPESIFEPSWGPFHNSELLGQCNE